MPSAACSQDRAYAVPGVWRVIDGDTLELPGGDRVRLLGIDAPEKGEPFSDQATGRLKALTASGPLVLVSCQERDIYGRVLATVLSGEININRVLLQEGMALPLLIPPCGRSVADDVLASAAMGALSRKGVYSLGGYEIIPHARAGSHIGKKAMVRGRVVGFHKGREAWHLNFGKDWKTDFTAVLLEEGRARFLALGLDAAALLGKEVLVIGRIKSYNGPEIIVRQPEQILPLEEIKEAGPRAILPGDGPFH